MKSIGLIILSLVWATCAVDSLGDGARTFQHLGQLREAYTSAVHRNLRRGQFSEYANLPERHRSWESVSNAISEYSVSLSKRRTNAFIRIALKFPGSTKITRLVYLCHFHAGGARGGFGANIDCHELDTDEN